MLSWLKRFVRALRTRKAFETRMNDEIRFHIDMEAEELRKTYGLNEDEARRRATLAFGGIDKHKERARSERAGMVIEQTVADVRYALRSLTRAPAFALAVVLVLALGIGASTAVFSAVRAVLVGQLPYARSDRLVVVMQQNSPDNRFPLSTVDYQAIEAQQRTFSAVGAGRIRQLALTARGEPQRIRTGWVTPGFFKVLGVTAALGRTLEPTDLDPKSPGVSIVTHTFAVREFGKASAALNQSITIDGNVYTIIGVLPRGVNELAGMRAEVWPTMRLQTPQRRGPFGLFVIGRLKDGATLTTARADLDDISRKIFPIWQAGFQDRIARLTPFSLREVLIGEGGRTLGIFAAAVALVLSIVLANVASLVLVRAIGRWREVALRAVLGATRARMARMLVIEALVLSLASGAVGLLIATGGVKLLAKIGFGISGLQFARIDLRTFAFAVALAVVLGAILGLYPLVFLTRRELAPALRSGDREIGATRSVQNARALFVTAEFALALPVLVGAALLATSFVRLQKVNPGFDPTHVLSLRVGLPSRYSDDAAIAAYWASALDRVRNVPGVQAAGITTTLPLNHSGDINQNNFDLIDHPVPPGGSQPVSPWLVVSAEYFDALGVRLLEGRNFVATDTVGEVIVSRAWARKYFPEGNVIGRKLVSGGCTSCPLSVVIGMVDDVKYMGLGENGEGVYSSFSQGWGRDLQLVVRTAANPAEALPRVQRALRSLDPAIPLDEGGPVVERVYASTTAPRQWAGLITAFGAVALGLAALGIFGMLSYLVSMRRREIGVRMAIGAAPNAVVGTIVKSGMRYALLGAALGVVLGLATSRWLKAALYDVSPGDPTTLIGVTLLLTAVALIASWLPARRAAFIQPIEALRSE